MIRDRLAHSVPQSLTCDLPASEPPLLLKNTAFRASAMPRERNLYCACHEICTWRLTKCCACHEICTASFTKCCACHVICTWRFTKCCACHEFCTWRFTLCCACHVICTWRFTKSAVPATTSARQETSENSNHNGRAIPRMIRP